MLFDSHAHLEDERFDDDRDELIRGLPEGCDSRCKCGFNPGYFPYVGRSGSHVSGIYAAVGIHPHEVSDDI